MAVAAGCETSLALPIVLPRRLARFNRVVTNPIQRQYAWLLPPWAVIHHRGRRSGREYRTPVLAFRKGSSIAIVVLYGEQSDWVQNVLAGGAEMVRAGRSYELEYPRLVDPAEAREASAAARALGRMFEKLLVAKLGRVRKGVRR